MATFSGKDFNGDEIFFEVASGAGTEADPYILKHAISGSVAVTGTFWQATQPVSGTFWQATQPISAAALPLPTGAATDATLGTTNTSLGATNETSAAADNSTSGLNGLLKRLLARLTALLPAALGAGGGLKVDGSGTALPVSLASLPALAAGTNAIGKLAANSGVDIGDVDVTSLPALAAGTNTIGNVGDVATTTGGTTGYSVISTAAVLAAEIKGSAGNVYSIQAFNINAAARYVRIYNQTGAPGSGDAANIVWRGMVPGNTAAAGYTIPVGGSKGIACATGIGIRASAAIADNDTTALAANELIFNVQYK